MSDAEREELRRLAASIQMVRTYPSGPSTIKALSDAILSLLASLSQAEAERDEARAEIERRELDRFERVKDTEIQRMLADALAADNARLREALKEIANDDFQHYANDRMIVGITRNRASAALKGAGT